MFDYQAFGLTIRSSFELPELLPWDALLDGKPDVAIRLGETPRALPGPAVQGVLYQAQPERFLLTVGSIANYLVENGNTITIQPAAGSQMDAVRLFLSGAPFGALLHQRKLLPLHGSAVDTPEGAMIFTGSSACGKSALAAAFHQRGYTVLADEICAIGLDEDARSVLYPALPLLRLWLDVLDKLACDVSALHKVRPELEKYSLPLSDAFSQQPRQVKAICMLKIHNLPDFEREIVQGKEKFTLLMDHTFMSQIMSGKEQLANHFHLSHALSQTAGFYRITRPQAPLRLLELSELIEKVVI